MSSSQTLRGWVPKSPSSYARPVQDEDATAGLCGAELPNGTGILLWPNGGEIHCAIVSSPKQFIVDDVVPLADVRVVATPGTTIRGTCVFMANGGLYCIANEHVSNVCTIRLYTANSTSNPTSWSASTIYTDHAGGPVFGNPNGVGMPLVLDSGRWVFATKVYDGPTSDTHYETRMGVWITDNDGSSWTRTLTYSHPYPAFGRVEFVSQELAIDPATGYLFMCSGTSISGVTYQNALWRSTDSGSNWTIMDGDGGNYFTAPRLSPFVDNGIKVYASVPPQTGLGDSTFSIFEYDGSGTLFTDWTDSGETWAAPGSGPDELTFRGVVTRKGVYFFTLDKVMYVAAGGWHTGYTGT